MEPFCPAGHGAVRPQASRGGPDVPEQAYVKSCLKGADCEAKRASSSKSVRWADSAPDTERAQGMPKTAAMPPTAADADATLIAPLDIDDEYREAGASDAGPPEGAGEQGRDPALGVPTAPTEREK